MNKSFKLLFAALFITAFAFAQTTVTSTTLSTAVDASQGVIVVASATGFTAPSVSTAQGGMGSPTGSNYVIAFVDKEAMRVNIVSGTRITVERGVQGTAASAHLSGAKIWVQPARWYATQTPSGACNSTSMAYLPKIVLGSPFQPGAGTLWNCTGATGVWVTYGSPGMNSVGPVIASATTIAPTYNVFHVSGTAAIVNITIPPGFPNGGTFTIIPDGAFTTTNAGNVAIASTGVVGKALTLTYDSGTGKVYPSY